VHSGCPLFWWLSHLSVSSLAAKGEGATDTGRKQGRRRRAIYPCFMNAAGATNSPPRENDREMATGELTECTHPTRRNGVATSEHRQAGAVNAPANAGAVNAPANAGCMLLTLTSAIRQ